MDVSDASEKIITIRCLQGWKGSVSVAQTATLDGFLLALNEAANLREAQYEGKELVAGIHRSQMESLEAEVAILRYLSHACTWI